MNNPAILLLLSGTTAVISLGMFFTLISKLSPERVDAIANKSKPGKAINCAVMVPLFLLLFLGQGSVRIVAGTALMAALTVLRWINHRSLVALGFDQSFLIRLHLHSALSVVAVALLIEALAAGLLN